MEYKLVKVTDSVSIPVPIGLNSDEEILFIASRIAFVNLPELEQRCVEAFQLWEDGKTIPLKDVLDELDRDASF